MWRSTQPVALAALVAAVKAADLQGAAVRDGPTVTGDAAEEVVSIGYVGDDEGVAIDGDASPAGLAVAPSREGFTVSCAVTVRSGAGDLVAARTRAYDLLALVADVLVADHTLGGAVMRAYVSDVGLRQAQTSGGAVAEVPFTVVCDAFTTTT